MIVINPKYCIDGVVVLYHPSRTVFKNIATYLPYLRTLYIIDNTEQPTDLFTDRIRTLGNCLYIQNRQNIGIASALNIAAKKAIYNSATWLLTMDQDSAFKGDDCLQLINYAMKQNVHEVGIVSPLQSSYLDEHSSEQLSDEPFTVITSGNLISLAAYQIIGGFNEQYFIDAVDTEYCLRLHQHKFKIKRLNNLVLQHSLGETRQYENKFHNKITLRNHNKIRRFYMTRNNLDLARKSLFTFPRFAISTLKNILVDIKNIFFYEDQKMDKIHYIFKGFLAFSRGNWGKIRE